jgi:PAS domain S-box-containing protein
MTPERPTPLLAQIGQYSSDLIAISDLTHTLTFLNPAGRAMIGLHGCELGQLTLDAIVPADARSTLHPTILATAETKGVWEGIGQLLNLDSGAIIHVHRSTFAVRDEAGQLTGFATVAHDVSAEVVETEKLRRSAETFTTLVENQPFGVYIVDQDFRLTIVSKGALKPFQGIDVASQPDFEQVNYTLWPAPFAAEVVARFRHTLETGEAYISSSMKQTRADSHEVEAYDWRIERIVLPDGEFGVACYFYDLTEREQLAAQVLEAQAREAANARELEVLYNEVTLGLAMIGPDLTLARMNPAFARLNWSSGEEHLGQFIWDVLPHLRAQIEPFVSLALKEATWTSNITVIGPDPTQGEPRREWVYNFYPVRLPNEEMAGVGLMVQDVTQQRQGEQALRASEQKLRYVLDQLFAFVGILTPDGTVTYANQSPLEAAGLVLSDVVGKNFSDAPWWNYSPDVQQQLREAIKSAADGQVVRYDVPVKLGKDLVTIDFQLSALRDDSGSIIGLIPSGVVIEDRVQAEQALRGLTNDLEQLVGQRTAALNIANENLRSEIEQREEVQTALLQSQKLEAVGRLVSGVAHDFNNVLAGVLSGLSLIEKKVGDQSVLDIVAMSSSAARRGAGLVKQMLAFARKQPLSPSRLDINEVFDEVRSLINLSLSAGIMLKVIEDAQTWPIVADSGQLHSSILNLALNARDAMPNGGQLTISATNSPTNSLGRPTELSDGDFVAISIADTGIGMNSETLTKFAEPFFTTKNVGKGTGLGVAMVYGFVNQSGGAMQVESTEGVGTRIILYLPRAPEVLATTVAAKALISTSNVRRILVVDDDDDLRFITVATLMEMGFDVCAAEDGRRALSYLREAEIDLVITDVVMPELDGPALAKSIRETHPNMPILFITGYTNTADLTGEMVLQKPFELQDLLDHIKKLLVTAA